MTIAAAEARRLKASPYARRLARERALPLDALNGSGPGGRIVAADVLGFVLPAAPPTPPAVAAPAAAPVALRTAAFAASVTLKPLRDLLVALEGAGSVFDIEDILLRAAGRAFAETLDATKVGGAPVALEMASRQAVFAAVPEMPLTSLRAVRLAALADNRNDAVIPAALSVRLVSAGDIRPLAMPLLPGRAMRLTACITAAGDCLECLITADAESIDEATAAAWLAALKSLIEHPLRLFV